MIFRQPSITRAAFEAGTGWRLEAAGACRGEFCVPLRAGADAADGLVDVAAIAGQMGLPIVTEDEVGVSVLGPWSGSGHALVSAEAPDLVLPDLDGNEFRLSSLRGQKVLILSWAPY
jgi:hypothetical protein